jgi:hypothetical protein
VGFGNSGLPSKEVLMKVFLFMALVTMMALPAFAFEYGSVKMTCSRARAMANEYGYVTVYQYGNEVDIQVTGLRGITVPFGTRCVVRATDNANCLVGYISSDWEHGK